ncbi:A24 family peptidase [Desulfonatronum lacustre]|uniref:A24 family peptidase n=1 Tax=Desulfonatronum lacustre TaxID=66849 RepID=UPI0004B0624F|nr:prepilin peptidase [Desulfonatronum lacustre]
MNYFFFEIIMSHLNYFIFLLIPVLIVVSITDLKYQKIPNFLTFPIMGLALAFHALLFGLEGFLFGISGLLLGIAIFLPLYIFGGMGAGDAKLMGAVGAVVGAKGVFISAIFTALYGGVYALLLLAIHRQYGRILFSRTWAVLKTFLLTRQYVPVTTPHPIENKPKLCYGVAIALGTITYLALNHVGFEFLGI